MSTDNTQIAAAAPETCPYCGAEKLFPTRRGTLYRCDTEQFDATPDEPVLIARGKACYERELAAVKPKLDALPADWTQDSSLETWFPYSAQELAAVKAERETVSAMLREANATIQMKDKALTRLQQRVAELEAENAGLRECMRNNNAAFSEAVEAANRAEAACAVMREAAQELYDAIPDDHTFHLIWKQRAREKFEALSADAGKSLLARVERMEKAQFDGEGDE